MQSLNLNKDNVALIKKKLIRKLREQFNLRMQLKFGQLKQSHLLKIIRRNIASIKTFLPENKK